VTPREPLSWRQLLATVILVFLVAFAGSTVAFALWLRDVWEPQVAFLGSGNRLSLLVSEGPARLILATGDDPINYENALTRFQPLFGRRIDLLLLAGEGTTLLVPLSAFRDPHTRMTAALAPLPDSPEADALGAIPSFTGPRRIRVGPSVSVTVETAFPFGADPSTAFPSWRATVERGETRIVVLSDGHAASLFPPAAPASVLAVSGQDPATAWNLGPAVALVANGDAISGPDMRTAFADGPRPPEWGFRVAPGEALRLRFVDGGIEIPSDSAQNLRGTPTSASTNISTPLTYGVRRRGRLLPAQTRP
jgi:hypothetical protein